MLASAGHPITLGHYCRLCPDVDNLGTRRPAWTQRQRIPGDTSILCRGSVWAITLSVVKKRQRKNCIFCSGAASLYKTLIGRLACMQQLSSIHYSTYLGTQAQQFAAGGVGVSSGLWYLHGYTCQGRPSCLVNMLMAILMATCLLMYTCSNQCCYWNVQGQMQAASTCAIKCMQLRGQSHLCLARPDQPIA